METHILPGSVTIGQGITVLN